MKRAFVFTVNLTDQQIVNLDNCPDSEREAFLAQLADSHIQRLFGNRVRYITYQAEVGEETGRLHLQGYLETTDSMRKTTVANLLKKWFFKGTSVKVDYRAGTMRQAVDYVHKEETRVAGPWTLGEPSKSHRTSSRRKHKSVLLECIADGLRPRDVWVRFPEVYMTHYRFIEHLQRAGLWGVSPDLTEEEE